MSAAEAIMWAVEKDPALRSDFCNLTLLDHTPTDDRMHATLVRALDGIPRLGQRVVGAPLRIATPEFAHDPTLDLDAHIRRLAVPAPGDERALLDVCGALAEQPLDRARPLWEFTLLEGLPDGRAALLQKIHHTITDGVGALRLSLALVDFEAKPDPDVPDPDVPDPDVKATRADDCGDGDGPRRESPFDVARAAVVDAAARSLGTAARVVTNAGQVLTRPHEIPARASDVARVLASLQRQVLVAERARSDVMTARSLRRHFEVYRLPLAGVRAAASALGGSVNDVYVTGLASALGRYHARSGSDVAGLRLAMPVSTRGRGDGAANRFVPTRVLVPIQPAHDFAALLSAVHDRLHTTKREAALGLVEGMAGLVSGLPTALLVAITRSQTRTIDFGASNLRGSPVPLYLAGARILANYPFGPRTGTPLNVTMLSYCDDLHVGLNIDPAAIVDVDAFMDDVAETFGELLALA